MTHQVLKNCLKPILEAESKFRRRQIVIFSLGIGAVLMLLLALAAKFSDWWSSPLAVLVVIASVGGILGGFAFIKSRRPSMTELARKVEEGHPDLNAALLTAMDMEPRSDGRLGYLQSQVLSQVTEHAIRNRWVKQVSAQKVNRAGWGQFAAIIAFFISLWVMVGSIPSAPELVDTEDGTPEHEKTSGITEIEIGVEPGNVEVEKGSRVIVEATFKGRIPPGAIVVLSDPKDGSIRGRLPMRAGLDDAVFSSVIDNVDSATHYEVRFEESKSDQFAITTYEHPELKQADATITPPEYAGLPKKEIEDTVKISVLEGSEVDWAIQVNKPVKFGELFGEDETVIQLQPSKEDSSILLASHQPKETQKYRLHLVDEKDRPNKRPPWFQVTVKKNQPPKLQFEFPKRDTEVTAVEEFSVEAKVWDDLGVKGAGIVFDHKGEQKEVVLASHELPGAKNHKLATMLAIEELGAKPSDLITYHLWAEDLDPQGKVRRVQSEMFLAEVRHFEHTYREAPAGQSGQGGQQGQSVKLLKLQKDILNASWKILREAQLGKSFGELSDDIEVVAESQTIAISKTDEVIKETEDPTLKSYFEEAKEHMMKAVEHFTVEVDPFKDPKLKKSPAEPLELAHASARSAYESLIKARARETNISQMNEPSSGQPQEREQQQMNLEMKERNLKYRENRQAETTQEAQEQQENLEVLNKLKELARRQEAIAKKIKELQNQLEEAKTEDEKEQIEKQLKRLQEEQQELLRELDDLSQRMDSEENRANMAEERKKLEETRENIRQTAEDLEKEKLADAANNATRAQRELKEVEDEFRKKTSHQFSEEMKGIRQAARELAEKQKDISKRLDDKAPKSSNTGYPFRTPKENLELSRELAEQSEALENLLKEIKEMSEEAKIAEPLLSDTLYEAVRETTINGVEQSLDEATRLVRYNQRSAAREPEQNAAQGIDTLKEKVEKAAEKILGSESDSLRLARAELDRLIEQTREEAEKMEASERGQKTGEENRPGSGQEPGEKGKSGQEASPKGEGKGKGEKGSEKGKGDQPGKGEQPGKGKGKGDRPSQMAGNEPGKGKGEKGSEGEGKGQMTSNQPGKGKGEGKGEDQNGKGKGKGEGKGQMASNEPGKGKGQGKGESEGKGKGKGEGQGQGGNDSPSSNRRERGRSLLTQGNPDGRRSAGSNFGGDDRGSNLPTGLVNQPPRFFEQIEEQTEPSGPITGEDYKDFANSLGNIEEMMNQEDLRNDIAKVLDNARAMRVDYKRDNAPPGAATIRKKIVNPLVELRSRVSEELAKLNKENPLAPIDRDPVPGEFRELVRKYYEELGAGN